MKPTPEPWWAEGLRFACTQCGRCCQGPEAGYVAVGEPEIERLAAHLELSLAQFGRRYLRKLRDGRLSLTEHPNKDCIFWVRGKGCSVYEARPDQCRTWPFWPEVIESEETWEAYAEDCPGMNRGRVYPRERIEALLDNQGGTDRGRAPRGKRLDLAGGSA